MSELREWRKHFYVDSQSNEFVCMTCDLQIRRSTDEVNDDPETVHQALNADCSRHKPTVDGPHFDPSSGLYAQARRCTDLSELLISYPTKMSELRERGKHFYVDSQSNEFVCMTCDLRIRRSTDEVNDDPEAVHQALDVDCSQHNPIVDGPPFDPSSGLYALARRCTDLSELLISYPTKMSELRERGKHFYVDSQSNEFRIPSYKALYKVNLNDVDYMLGRQTVRSLIEEVGFEEEVLRRVIIREQEMTGKKFIDAAQLMTTVFQLLDARFS